MSRAVTIGRGRLPNLVLRTAVAGGYAAGVPVLIVYVAAFRDSLLGLVALGFIVVAVIAQFVWFPLRKYSVAYVTITDRHVTVVDAHMSVTLRRDEISGVRRDGCELEFDWTGQDWVTEDLSGLRLAVAALLQDPKAGTTINLGLYTPRQRETIVRLLRAAFPWHEQPDRDDDGSAHLVKPGEWTSRRVWWSIVLSVVLAAFVAFCLFGGWGVLTENLEVGSSDWAAATATLIVALVVLGLLTRPLIRSAQPLTLTLSDHDLTLARAGRRTIEFGDIAELSVTEVKQGAGMGRYGPSFLIVPKPEYFERHGLRRSALRLSLDWEAWTFSPDQTDEILPRLDKAVSRAGGAVWGI